jgi:hypothetical protein
MNTIYFDSRVEDEELRKRIYAGQILVFTPTPGTRALCEFAGEMIKNAFGGVDPRAAQHSLDVRQFVDIIADLKPRFIHHPRSKELLVNIIKEYKCDLKATYFDVPRLRAVAHGDYLKSGIGYVLHPHRDTWYSSTMTQIHWWLPIYEIESESSLAFHTKYWQQPIKNDSYRFNYFDWNRERKTAAKHINEDTRFQPHAQEEIEVDPQLRVVCPPGGLIMFSAAHLHSTVPNTSGRTRFSIDFRTVNVEDLASRRGAINIDSASQGSNLRDFLNCLDRTPIPETIIAEYEEPGATQGHEEDLVFRPSATMLQPEM